VVDHFNYDSQSASEKHDVLVVSVPKPVRKDVKNYFAGPGPLAIPHAVGQILGNDSPLLTPILRAPSTAYAYNPKDEAESVEDLFGAGQQLALISALQARNSARFTVLGAVEMLEDKWFDAKVKHGDKSAIGVGNREFAAALTSWTFKEVGVLKVGRLQHHLSNGKPAGILNETAYPVGDINPSIYRIKNDVVSSSLHLYDSCTNLSRHLPLSSPNTPVLIYHHLCHPPLMQSNSKSPCYHHSTVSLSSQSAPQQTVPSTLPLSPCPTNTASSTSASITNDHS
jgi:oligosaccharyltransferase subunit beta